MTELLPLVPDFKASGWRQDDPVAHEAEGEFARARPGVLRRDKNACRFCGFRMDDKWVKGTEAAYYRQVHHLNNDHHDNRPENLVTACMHCHAVHHVGLWGSKGEAMLAWLPEIPQYAVSHLHRTIAFARKTINVTPKGASHQRVDADGTRFLDAVNALADRIAERVEVAREKLGTSGLDDLVAILESSDALYRDRTRFLAGFRVVFGDTHKGPGGIDVMPKVIDAMRRGPYSPVPHNTWLEIARQAGVGV